MEMANVVEDVLREEKLRNIKIRMFIFLMPRSLPEMRAGNKAKYKQDERTKIF